MAFFCMGFVVSVFVLFSFSSDSFSSECFLSGGVSYTFLYPALLVVLCWLVFLSVLFRGSPHVTACGLVISLTKVKRW